MRYVKIGSVVAVAAIVALGAGYWLIESEPSPDAVPDSAEVAHGPQREKPAPPVRDQVITEQETATETTAANDEHTQRLLAMGFTEAEIAEQRQLEQLKQSAEARFDATVAADKVSADDVQPAVRQLFKTVLLEPAFTPGETQEGFIDGMRIAELSAHNPLAQAGFKANDRLTRINGQPLQDPAQIPHLFTQLGERFEVCAQRDNGEYCRFVQLEG